jgi:two-component system OmpR family sensor kinase
MHIYSAWFTNLRGRLIAWYLSVLAVLLAGLCIFQTVILTHYFQSTRASAVGHSSASGYGMLLQARLTLIVGALVVFIVTAIVALPIINRALGPLQHVTQTAEAIAAGDLARRANLAPSVDEVGRLGGAFDTMVDRLQDALATATGSEERMRQFLADASHELRTPLTVLRGTSQILLRQKDLQPGEFDAALAAIHDESIRLSRLVDDLLTLSRLDAGQPLDPNPVAISPFLAEFVGRYASAWPSRLITVEAAELDGTRAHVDPEALRRILTNVVDNAARYSTPGRPIVIAGVSAANSVSITVRDEGPGLSPEDAKRIFERFYRGNKSRSRLSGGAGLGLAIVHALVEKSQGEIRIDTSPDRGTTVAIMLPLLSKRVGTVAPPLHATV